VAALDGVPNVDIPPVLEEAFEPLLKQRIAASDAESAYPKPFDLPIVLLPPDVEEPELEAHAPAPNRIPLAITPAPYLWIQKGPHQLSRRQIVHEAFL
jgi:hypothetical protein